MPFVSESKGDTYQRKLEFFDKYLAFDAWV